MLTTRSVIQRFQIEDLVFQDDSEVVFHATDTETGSTVCVRRFFPFGPAGRGLNKNEKAAYDTAVKRLIGVKHPALLAVICGSCDPVDGIPFIVTEWTEGNRLQSFIGRSPLSPVEAMNLISLALEVCQFLSEILAEEAIWIETSLETIIVGSDESHRRFTFWISPMKWLGKNKGRHGLETIVSLAEQVLDWEGREVSIQAGMGLGSWLKWLRASAKTASIQEAREMLAKSFSTEVPSPTKRMASLVEAKRALVIRKKEQPSGRLFLIIGVVALLAIAGGGLGVIQWRNSNTPLPSLAPPESTHLQALPEDSVPPGDQKVVSAPPDTPLRADGIYTTENYDLLMAQDGKPVIFEGTLENFKESKSGFALFLLFSESPPAIEARGGIVIDKAPKDLSEAKLQPLKGQKIRLHGKVDVQSAGGANKRPVIMIAKRADIEVVK